MRNLENYCSSTQACPAAAQPPHCSSNVVLFQHVPYPAAHLLRAVWCHTAGVCGLHAGCRGAHGSHDTAAPSESSCLPACAVLTERQGLQWGEACSSCFDGGCWEQGQRQLSCTCTCACTSQFQSALHFRRQQQPHQQQACGLHTGRTRVNNTRPTPPAGLVPVHTCNMHHPPPSLPSPAAAAASGAGGVCRHRC